MSAAEAIAGIVRRLVPDWVETSEADHHWRFTDPDEDYKGRYIEVDGRLRELRNPPVVMDGKHVGPSVTGYDRDTFVQVVLPNMVDSHDMRNAVAAVTAVVELPDTQGRGDLTK